MNLLYVLRLVLLYSLVGIVLTATADAQSNNPKARPQTLSAAILTQKYEGVVGNSVTLSASLVAARSKDTPLPHRKLAFFARWGTTLKTPWTFVGDAETDDKGVSSVSLKIPTTAFDKVPTGQIYLEIRFPGDLNFENSVRYNKTWARAFLRVTRPNQEEANPSSGESSSSTAPSTANNNLDSTAEGNEPPANGNGKPLLRRGTVKKPSGDNTSTEEPQDSSGTPSSNSTTADSTAPPTNLSLNPILLRKILGSTAGKEDSAIVTSDMKISPDAVALIKDGFAISPPRFWFEARLEKFNVKEKTIFGLTSPIPMKEVEAVINWRLVDIYTRSEWKGTARGQKNTTSIIVISHPGKQVDAVLRPSKLRTAANANGNTKSPTMDIDLSGLMNTDDGRALVGAVQKAVSEARKNLDKCDWMSDVLDVETDIITLSAGQGANLKMGDRLEIKRYRKTITNLSGQTIRVVYVPVGTVEVIKVEAEYVEARVVNGKDFQKGDFACRGVGK